MPRRRPPLALAARVALAATIAGVVLLSACGGGAKETPSVEEQLGVDSAGLLKRQGQVENLIRDCMRSEGFQYVPVDPAAQRAALAGSSLTEEEFERQYGYGLTTLYEQRRQLAAGGPNLPIRNALSPAQRTAYDRALFGANFGATFDVAADQGDYSQLGGCTKKAAEGAFGGPEVLQSITARLDELEARILADPRMVKAVAKWSGCMRLAGYELADPDQVDVVLQRKLDQIVGPPDRAAPSSASAATAYDRAALAALQREEVAMVAADLACEKRHISPVEQKVRDEYERAFRDQNGALLAKAPRP